MLESHKKDRGFGHNAGEPLKRKGIQTRCQRAEEKKGDPYMMLESRRNDKGFGHDAEEPLKR